MKFLKIFLIVVILILAGFTIWTSTLPSGYDFNREVTIEAPVEHVFSYVNNVQNWEQWSAWAAMDSKAKFTYGDVKEGEGAWYTWEGDTVGSGKLTIVKSEPGKRIETKLEFSQPNEVTSSGYWIFEEVEGGTKITWGNKGELPFVARFMGLMMDSQVGPSFEDGLNRFKSVAESSYSEWTPEFTPGSIEVVNHEAKTFVGVKYENLPWSEMEKAYENGYAQVFAALGADAQNMTGAPFGQFLLWDEENQLTSFIAGVPVNTDIEVELPLVKGNMYGGKVLQYAHYGPYEMTGDAHIALEEYIQQNGLVMNGNPWESYITDPGAEPDTSKWLTLVYYPIK